MPLFSALSTSPPFRLLYLLQQESLGGLIWEPVGGGDRRNHPRGYVLEGVAPKDAYTGDGLSRVDWVSGFHHMYILMFLRYKCRLM